jgi:hypothetical protein
MRSTRALDFAEVNQENACFVVPQIIDKLSECYTVNVPMVRSNYMERNSLGKSNGIFCLDENDFNKR